MLPFKVLRQSQDMQVMSDPTRASDASTYTWKNNSPAVAGKTVTSLTSYAAGTPMPVRPGVPLARFGELTTPALAASTFRWASRWTWVRYFWAFEPHATGKSLRLSAPAMSLVEHHRQLFSEQIGIALGLEAILQHLLVGQPNGTTVEPVDADAALGDQQVGGIALGSHANAGKSRPDYFVVRTQPGGLIDVLAIECKGTFSPEATNRQLAKAASQLQTVVLGAPVPPGGPVPPIPAGAAAPTGYITAAALNDEQITVELFDPPGDARWLGQAAPRTRRRAELPLVRRDDPSRDVIEDPERFRRRLVDLVELRQLSVAGRTDAATARAREISLDAPATVQVRPPTSYRDPDFGQFDGARLRLPLDHGEILEVFLGTRHDRAEAIERDDDEAIAAAADKWDSDRGKSQEDAAVVRGGDGDDPRSVTVARGGGQLMRASVVKPSAG